MVILTENDTLVPSGDLRSVVQMAIDAEAAGADAVMLSDHVCLGPEAGAEGRTVNPREYAAPGNQDPATPWPSSVVMASAIAAATSTVRIALAALITPLRNPVVLAKDLATLDRLSAGRLVVQPTVSWSREEYAAVDVSFGDRGRILDDHLAAMQALWAGSPASHHGEFFSFDEVYSEPKPMRPSGPVLWFGGQRMHPALLRRIVAHGAGFHPFGTPSEADLSALGAAMGDAGRSLDELEMIGGTRATFTGRDDCADLAASMTDFAEQVAAGSSTFCMKPSQHTNDPANVGALVKQMVDHLDRLGRDRPNAR